MTFRHLDYFDLKKCIQVNKTFKSLVNHASIRGTVFRGNVLSADEVLDIKDLDFHPALDMVHSESSETIDGVTFFSYEPDNFKDWPLTETSAASECATNPALSLIVIQVYDFPSVTVRGKYGVTVLQVMKGLCRVFAKKLPKRAERPYWLEESETATYRDSMGDRTGWHGFTSKELDSKGRLVLCSDGFDS